MYSYKQIVLKSEQSCTCRDLRGWGLGSGIRINITTPPPTKQITLWTVTPPGKIYFDLHIRYDKMILAFINKTPFVRWFKRSTLTLYIGLASVIEGVRTTKTVVVCDVFKHECKWCHKICRKLFYRDVQ